MFDFNGDGTLDPRDEYLAYKAWEKMNGLDEDEEEEGDPDLLIELAEELEEEEAARELEMLDEMDEGD